MNCFQQGFNGRWYIIPLDVLDEFDEDMLYYLETKDEESIKKYEKYFSLHPMNYMFEKIQIRKGKKMTDLHEGKERRNVFEKPTTPPPVPPTGQGKKFNMDYDISHIR